MERETGIDVLKTVGCFSVIALHYTSYYYDTTTKWGSYIVLNSIRWFVFGCIGFFILATGYLNCNKKFKKSYYIKLIPTIMIFFVYSILSQLVITPFDGMQSFWRYIDDGINWYFWGGNSYYWYMNFYIPFFLIIPFLNIIVKNISKKDFQWFIILIIIIISLPSFIEIVGDFWEPIKKSGIKLSSYFPADSFPFIYYFIGAYLRKYKNQTKHKLIIIVILITSLVFHSCLDWIYLQKYQNHFEIGQHVYTFNSYGNIFTIVSCTLFMICMIGLNFKSNIIKRIFAFLSAHTLEIYLGLMIADKIVQRFCERIGFSIGFSIMSFFVWFFGELIITICLALLIKLLRVLFRAGILFVKGIVYSVKYY